MPEFEPENKKDEFSLSGILESFEGTTAIIILEGNQKINWPIAYLPKNCLAGEKVRLKISTANSEAIERELIAKTILNQILKEK